MKKNIWKQWEEDLTNRMRAKTEKQLMFGSDEYQESSKKAFNLFGKRVKWKLFLRTGKKIDIILGLL